jgi:hypothetical protein
MTLEVTSVAADRNRRPKCWSTSPNRQGGQSADIEPPTPPHSPLPRAPRPWPTQPVQPGWLGAADQGAANSPTAVRNAREAPRADRPVTANLAATDGRTPTRPGTEGIGEHGRQPTRSSVLRRQFQKAPPHRPRSPVVDGPASPARDAPEVATIESELPSAFTPRHRKNLLTKATPSTMQAHLGRTQRNPQFFRDCLMGNLVDVSQHDNRPKPGWKLGDRPVKR